MKLKILVIEVQPGTFNSLNLLDVVCKDRIQEIQYAQSLQDAQQTLYSFKPNLILAEIHSEKDTILKWLNQIHPLQIPILVTSANPKVEIPAFNSAEMDYIDSPIKLRDLEKCLLKVYNMLNPHFTNNIKSDSINRDTLLLWDNDRLKPIVIEQIVKIKSDGAYSEIYLKGERMVCSSKNIGTYEGLLKEKKFMRIHHSCLVNLDCVEYYKPGMKAFVALCDSGIEYVSKSRKREFLNRFQRVKS